MDDQNQQQPVVDQGGMPQAPVQPEPQAPVEPVVTPVIPVPEPTAPVSEPMPTPEQQPVMPEPQAPAAEPVQDPNQGGGQQPGGTL